ncbi:MAG: tRNA (adenosine(37)-N6)-threonylcarbamoyltransferase complex dimerization subunit type 1 TsaB [Solirubrobacteraceae bacterium]
MRVLGFDTATSATAVALLDFATGTVHERRDDPPAGTRPHHTTHLLALITGVMSDAAAGWDAIDRIAVGTGPGTFTGLRIGIASAHALARARGLPLVGVSTLHGLALAAAGEAAAGERAVVAVIDARRGELFAAAWAIDDVEAVDAEPLLAPAPFAPDELLTRVRALGSGVLVAGDGAVAWAQRFEDAGARVAGENRVSAAPLCRLATQATDLPGSPDGVAPDYLRAPDAKPRARTAVRV